MILSLLPSRLLRFLPLIGMLGLAACGSPGPASGPLEASEEPEDSFEMAMNASESELSEMRGGFAAPGGLNINFGLDTSTRVNGMLVSNFNISGKNLNSLSSQALQQIVQVGTTNSFSASNTASTNQSIVTVIQNNTNNVTIQNTNQLSLSVSNLASLRNQAAFLNSVGPLIRSLH